MVSKKMQIVGPGEWECIHLIGADANTPAKMVNFCNIVRMILSNLRCETCRGHAAEYLKLFPPEKDDPFVWGWKFHNAVNKRLGKPEVSYDAAKRLYIEGEVKNCGGDCG